MLWLCHYSTNVGNSSFHHSWVYSLSVNDDSSDNVTKVSTSLKDYIKMYHESDPISQLIILNLQDHSKYTAKQHMDAFGCSLYKVKQAWRLCRTSDGLVLPETKKHNRNKLDLNKAEHFLDFIFSSGILQDIAYGVTSIKYDNGEEQKIAHAVLTAKFSHAITMYKESCNEVGYSPLSDWSLFRILSAIKPSQRKCLHNAGCYHGNLQNM